MPETVNGPWEQEEQRFRQYLEHERGLASVTIKRYLLYVRVFLSESFGQGRLHYSRLHPHHITDFILRYARRHKPGTAALMVTVLRSFLRYLHQRGALSTELAECVPTVPNWRLTTLPKGLEPYQVKLVLQTCNRRTNVGCRNYAVLLLLARLGLRASEVCLLTLDDINWAAGELMIHGKGAKRHYLPLPSDVGKALVAYIKKARPECSSRRLFIRARAPLTGFANYSAVGTIVSRAILHTGIHAPHKGAHTLRHSVATLMLRGGASLEEIGKILRHKRPETTSIYAKVDLAALRALAQPWPGGRS
jgi:site-specific recombinase XerD